MSEPNAVKVAKKRVRKAPHRWTSVEIVEAVIERMQQEGISAAVMLCFDSSGFQSGEE